jgi:hypothetical protein
VTAVTDQTIQTSRFAFQLLGNDQVLEPKDYNNILQKVDSNLPANVLASAAFTAGAGVAVATPAPAAVQRVVLTLTAAEVDATFAHKYGGLDIFTWPNTNILLVNAKMNLVATKDGAQIEATDQPTVAVGSVVASNTTLATTMIDTVGVVTTAATLAAAVQKNGPAALAQRYIAAGASNKLFLNIGATANTGGGDGNVKFAGTITLDFVDLGLYS